MARVLTPGGYRDDSLVHKIPEGQKLCFDRDHYVLRDKHTGTPTAAVVPGAFAPNTVSTAGWQAFVGWQNNTGFPVKTMSAQFTVPDIPTNIRAQTIFLFPGIQNLGGDVGILQPVLQFGQSAIGGGPVWYVASWYVPTTGHAFYSNDLVPVSPGDILVGQMTMTAASGGTFNYSCAFAGIPGTECDVEGIAELKWCNVTLESYDVSSPNEYPATDSIFIDLAITAAPDLAVIPWVPGGARSFGESASVLNPSATTGEINISF